MEDGLVHIQVLPVISKPWSLNPCCSGRWPRTISTNVICVFKTGLNPYCSGRWSRTNLINTIEKLLSEVS